MIETRTSSGSGWERICTVLVRRMETLDLLDEGATSDTCLIEISQFTENRWKANKKAEARLLRPQATTESSMETKMQGEEEIRKMNSHISPTDPGSIVQYRPPSILSTLTIPLCLPETSGRRYPSISGRKGTPHC